MELLPNWDKKNRIYNSTNKNIQILLSSSTRNYHTNSTSNLFLSNQTIFFIFSRKWKYIFTINRCWISTKFGESSNVRWCRDVWKKRKNICVVQYVYLSETRGKNYSRVSRDVINYPSSQIRRLTLTSKIRVFVSSFIRSESNPRKLACSRPTSSN